jgi:hypothetical protein
MQPALHGAGGHAEHLGHLGLVEALEVAEHEHGAVRGGQLGEHGADLDLGRAVVDGHSHPKRRRVDRNRPGAA